MVDFLVSGYAGRYNLLPVYDYLVERIRKYDNSTLIFYEPVTYGIFTPINPSGWLGTGFRRAPGANHDKSAPNKSVLSYHYYCWVLQTDYPNSTMPFWKKIICDSVNFKFFQTLSFPTLIVKLLFILLLI